MSALDTVPAAVEPSFSATLSQSRVMMPVTQPCALQAWIQKGSVVLPYTHPLDFGELNRDCRCHHYGLDPGGKVSKIGVPGSGSGVMAWRVTVTRFLFPAQNKAEL